MNERFCTVGEIELCYERMGDPSDPALLLIMGLGTQMIGWDDELCGLLVDRGFHVIRFDNRDVGHSTRFDDVPPPSLRDFLTRRPRHLAYTLEDMAADPTGLLDALEIDAAHVVGASMGGMIAQELAIRRPERVLSLVSIMSTTGNRWVGQPVLRAYPHLLRRPRGGKQQFVERMIGFFELVGSRGDLADSERVRRASERAWDRGLNPAGTGRQLAAIIAAGDRTKGLARITAPTTVIHGSVDRLIRPSGGRATAKAIPGARLVIIEGMGHDLPRPAWPRIVDEIAATAARAPASGAVEAG
jgi:pimeloyl-ACP methyl ester carboxylesterase